MCMEEDLVKQGWQVLYAELFLSPGKIKTIYINIKGDKTGLEAVVAITGLLAIYVRKRI